MLFAFLEIIYIPVVTSKEDIKIDVQQEEIIVLSATICFDEQRSYLFSEKIFCTELIGITLIVKS